MEGELENLFHVRKPSHCVFDIFVFKSTSSTLENLNLNSLSKPFNCFKK